MEMAVCLPLAVCGKEGFTEILEGKTGDHGVRSTASAVLAVCLQLQCTGGKVCTDIWQVYLVTNTGQSLRGAGFNFINYYLCTDRIVGNIHKLHWIYICRMTCSFGDDVVDTRLTIHGHGRS